MFIDAAKFFEGPDVPGNTALEMAATLQILVVNDEEKACQGLCDILQGAGYQAATAESATSAISILENHLVQLMLLDLNMPDISGHGVLEYIAEKGLDTQVIIIAGEANVNEAKRSLRYDFVHEFVKKPFVVNDLIHLIANTKKIIKLKQAHSAMQIQLEQSEQMHRFFIEKSPDAVYLINPDGEFTFLNNTMATLLGYDPADIEGKHYSCLVHQEDMDKAAIVFAPPGPGQRATRTSELRLHCKHGGQPKYVEITAISGDLPAIGLSRAKANKINDLPGIYGFIRDINERKIAENHLCKLNLAIDSSPNLIFITDTLGIIEYVNHKITETTGYTADEVVGHNPRIFGSGETGNEDYKMLWDTISSGKPWQGVFKNKKKNGEIYWAQQSIAPLINSEGAITSYVAIQEDVTQALLLSEKLSYQATHDALTQLINRHEFDRRLERVVMTTCDNDTEHALCYIDIDQFKLINDTCSHIAGDELLRQISAQLSGIIRRSDTVARLGGDEFAILMEYCSLKQAERTTKKIHKLMEKFQFHWEDKSFRIGVSIGLVVINTENGGADMHMKQADMACYMAKESGRNRTHIYREDDQALAQHHGEMKWVAKINRALQENLFCLYTQAIVPLGLPEGEHCEVLIRMKDGQGNIVMPDVFLPAAERYQLSPKIDRWVIRSVFNWFTKHPKRLNALSMCAINLSGLSLSDPNLLAFIEGQFKLTNMPAEKICFEITETAAIANLSIAIEFIARLKALGCKFSLDDFGSGLSSFAYLKNLPVDFLKIDGFFIKDIEHDPVDLAMVKSINDIGHVMGKKTIAEFVENRQILQTLHEIKVDYVQGYCMGTPKPITQWRT